MSFLRAKTPIMDYNSYYINIVPDGVMEGEDEDTKCTGKYYASNYLDGPPNLFSRL